MTQSYLSTEDGKILMAETSEGIADASSMNDISVETIHKETFDTDPSARGWQYGTLWVYDGTNHRLKMA